MIKLKIKLQSNIYFWISFPKSLQVLRDASLTFARLSFWPFLCFQIRLNKDGFLNLLSPGGRYEQFAWWFAMVRFQGRWHYAWWGSFIFVEFSRVSKINWLWLAGCSISMGKLIPNLYKLGFPFHTFKFKED